MEHYVKQNNVVDIYEQYFPSEGEDGGQAEECPTAKTINLFSCLRPVGVGRDLSRFPQPVTKVSWSTGEEANRFVAAAYCPQGGDIPRDYTRDSYVWDVGNPSHPLHILKPPSALITLEYCPKDSSIILGGCYNGQIGTYLFQLQDQIQIN
ncbi:DNAI2 [Cordylochernes scorpioides]|uniref:DNAI2 n=1 Tax=Cordylochernes scorpioides TaxID=51811 RepID=A0ABY6KIB7_9ARAC|nr:DNAI2 [Cordylochernes scorpioides]